MEHSVVLPEPDGPTRATISPDSIVRSAWSSATTSVSATSYTLRTARSSRVAVMRGFRSLRPGPRAGPGGGRRRTRRRRPTSSRTALVTIRRGEMSSGIEPGGITASRSRARPPAMTTATAVTTTACTTRPANSVRLRAPIALSTPYRPSRSTVSRAKNRATTTTAMAIVTPMIWLNVERCCSTPGMASTAWVMVSDSVAPPVAASIAAATSATSASSVVRTTRAWKTSSPSCSSGRFADSTSRHVAGVGPQRPLPRVGRVGHEPDHGHGRAGGPEEDLHADLDAVGAQHVVGVDLAGSRWVGHADGRQLVAEQRRRGEVSRAVARDPGAELDEADAAALGDAGDGLDRRPRVGVDAAAQERRLRRRRVDDEVAVLGPHGVGRAADQAVEQTAEEHHEHGDEREDDGRGDEAAGPPAQLAQGQPHRRPAPVVAMTGIDRQDPSGREQRAEQPEREQQDRPADDGRRLEAQPERWSPRRS